MSKLPEGWINVLLSDVAQWGSGGTPARSNSAYYGGDIPWVKTGELGQGLIKDTEENITYLGLQNSSAKIFPKGSVLIAMYGATIGKTAILGIDAATNQACAVGIPREGITTTEYLFYYLSSQKNAFIEAGKGAAQPNISQKVIKDWTIPLASFNQQKRIADKLNSLLARVDACRDRLERIPRILERFRQAVLTAGTSGQLTEDWRITRMAQMQAEPQISTTATLNCDDSNQDYDLTKLPLSRLLREPLQNGRSVRDGDGAWVLRLTSIRKGKIDLQERKQGLWSRNDAIRFFVQEGDFLVARGNGSLRLVGRGGLVGKVTEEVAYPDTMIRIRPNTSLIAPEFLTIIWDANSVREQIEQIAKTTAGIWKISQSDLEGIILDVPTLEEQAEIILRVEVLFAYADRLETRYRKAYAIVYQLTSALLDKAFRGELVPQDPDDEPASVLLERIRMMRATTEENVTKQRQRKPASDKPSQSQVIMLKRKDIQLSHLSDILKARGSMTAETLWSASQLEIDDFYDQLKDEEAKGLLKETREESADALRLLEAV